MTAFRSPSNALREFIDNCAACERLCLEAIVHCRDRGGDFADGARLSALSSCAEVCRDAVSATQASTEVQPGVVRACVSNCERAAKFCADFPEDKLLRACANACRNAARSCTEMAHLGGD